MIGGDPVPFEVDALVKVNSVRRLLDAYAERRVDEAEALAIAGRILVRVAHRLEVSRRSR